MIKNFEEYNKLNEEKINKDFAIWAFYLFYFFNGIGSDTHRNTTEEFEKYIKNNVVLNPEKHDINKAIDEVKKKVTNDPKITNKQEIFNIIDSTLYLYDKKDKFSNALYSSTNRNDGKTKCFVMFLKDKDGNDTRRPLIMLEKDAPLSSIRHELYHIVERYMKKDIKDILNMFDFTTNYKEYNRRYGVLTNFEYRIDPLPKEYFDYVTNPSEIYTRLNNLKHFLYEYNYIKSPNDTIPKEVFLKLFTGELYKELPNEEEKKIFRESDFMHILLFMDLVKLRIMDDYVMTTSPNKNNKS